MLGARRVDGSIVRRSSSFDKRSAEKRCAFQETIATGLAQGAGSRAGGASFRVALEINAPGLWPDGAG